MANSKLSRSNRNWDAMLFNSFHFLLFFSVVFSIYWLLWDHRSRLVWLLGTSCYFYMSWNPWLILLILFSSSVDYVVAIRLEGISSLAWRRVLLVLSISFNLGILVYFKYSCFFFNAAKPVFSLFWSGSQTPLEEMILPLGISFYTFEAIGYIVDVYQHKQKPVYNVIDYALYLLFFPHLVAGPIVRPHDFLPQLKTRKRWSWQRLQWGVQLFILGLFKKAVIADSVAPLVDMVFLRPEQFESSAVWIAVLCYAVQIYCDFSGYSDMAIGLGHSLGFTLPANFRSPYLSGDIAEFWGRWHITLSLWLRDYLYIPLGGNRSSSSCTSRNLLITMLLGGLWHGANWTFLIWGLYHGTLLTLHRTLPRPQWLAAPQFRPICVVSTFLSVCVGWVFFRAHRVEDAGAILWRMFIPTAGTSLTDMATMVALSYLLFVFVAHLFVQFGDFKKIVRSLPRPLLGTVLGLLLLLVQLLIPETNQAFIYFQF